MTDPIARGQDAQRLLDDPLLKEAFEKVEAAILDKLKGPATGQDMEWLLALRMVPKVKGWLIGCIQSGKVELQIREQEEIVKGRK